MKIIFRVDASLMIGTGHVMRCLTLADALAVQGADCLFICREHQGDLIEYIRNKDYRVFTLPVLPPKDASSFIEHSPAHSHWLGSTQTEDAAACTAILASEAPDWLIVDHYALDASWELALKPHYRKLMVIDDLADRPHLCDLLLDQTFGREVEDYRVLVPVSSQLLCGSQYALLRPEFAALRDYSLQRRANPQLRHLLISMGGVDKDNATSQVLTALRESQLPDDCRITVIMGSTAPWLAEVERLAGDMPWSSRVMVGVSDMARLMADSDLAIGAAGATSWERCCLGLPTIMLVLADNQAYAASLLDEAGAVQPLVSGATTAAQIKAFIVQAINEKEKLNKLAGSASKITDGRGCPRVAEWLISGVSKQ